jgi:hypothetical protein
MLVAESHGMHYPMVVAMLLLPLGKPVIQPEELQG